MMWQSGEIRSAFILSLRGSGRPAFYTISVRQNLPFYISLPFIILSLHFSPLSSTSLYIPFTNVPSISRHHHRFGFTRCKVRLSRLIRRFEVHFSKILPLPERNFLEKPSYSASPITVRGICKTPKRFRWKEPNKGRKYKSLNSAIWIKNVSCEMQTPQ